MLRASLAESPREMVALRGWSYGVAAHLCKSWLRREYRRRALEMSGTPDSAPACACGESSPTLLATDPGDLPDPRGRDPPEVCADDVLEGLILRALEALPPDYRVVATLRLDAQMSYAQIAEALGLPESQVKTRLHRARLMLREALADEV